MSIIKETIRFNPNLYGFSGDTLTGDTMNIKISFGSHDNFNGWQQEIDRQTQIVTAESINDAVDGEARRFSKKGGSPQRLRFKFWSGSVWVDSYTVAGFTSAEIDDKTLNVRNSFWIFDYYNNFDPNNRQKMFSVNLTTIGNKPSYTTNTEFDIRGASDQLYYWYIPLSYLNTLTGATVNGYLKVSFFNAKTGNVQLFYNEANEGMSSGQVELFEVELDLLENTWIFTTSNYPSVWGKEVKTGAYTERVNETVDDFDNQQQVPPDGNTFDYTDATYFTT